MGFLRLVSLLVALATLCAARSSRVERQVPGGQGCRQLADVVFLYDGSDSMTTDDFIRERDFIINLISRLSLDEVNGVRAGAVVFDSTTSSVRLNPFNNFFSLKSKIEALVHGQGGTHTHRGIAEVRDIFQKEGRFNVPHILVLLTDGRSKYKNLTIEQADLAKSDGIQIVSIGIGTRVDENELLNVASAPDLYFQVDNFAELTSLTLNIFKTVCPTTTTTSTTTTTTTSTTPPPPNPCDDCRFSNGVAYAPHETECYLFYHCVGTAGTRSDGRLKPYLKRCPWGQFWDQSVLTCKPATQVDCVNDRCKQFGVTAYAMTTSCRGFWACDGNRTSYADCCPINERFVEGRGCIPDQTCIDDCPYKLDEYVKPVCDGFMNPYPLDETKYMIGTMIRDCPRGTAFSETACSCSRFIAVPIPQNDAGEPICREDIYLPFDANFNDQSGNYLTATPDGNVRIEQIQGAIGGGAARFDGGSVTMWKYANDHLGEMFAITFRYQEIPVSRTITKPEAIVSNSGCEQRCTVAMVFDRAANSVEGHLSTSISGRSVASSQAVGRGVWHDVLMVYDGSTLTVRVDGTVRPVNAEGLVHRASSALQLGNSCAEFDKFYGYIDEFRLYKSCVPPIF